MSGAWCVCADTLGGGRWPVLPFDPISLVLAQRNGVEPPKKSAFEASTSPWWARPPLPFGRKPQRDRLVRQVDLYMVGRPGAQVSLTQSAVMLGLRVRGRGGRDPTPPVAAPLSAFLWGGTGSRGHNPPPKKTAHTHKPQTPTSPLPKSGEDESRLLRQKRSREWWSHRGKKSAFLWRLDTVSLGKHQRNGVESQNKPSTTAQSIGAHVQSARINKRGNPRRGFPLRPPPALYEAQESSARCGGRPEALPLDSTTFEKVDETFKRALRAGRSGF